MLISVIKSAYTYICIYTCGFLHPEGLSMPVYLRLIFVITYKIFHCLLMLQWKIRFMCVCVRARVHCHAPVFFSVKKESRALRFNNVFVRVIILFIGTIPTSLVWLPSSPWSFLIPLARQLDVNSISYKTWILEALYSWIFQSSNGTQNMCFK